MSGLHERVQQSIDAQNAIAGRVTGLDIEAIRARAALVHDDSWPQAACASAADVPALLDEIERLRRQVRRVESLTKDTDGGDVHPDANIPCGEILRMLYDEEAT